MNIQFFFGQALSQNSSKPLIVKDFYLLNMPHDYCFRRAAQGQLSQRSRKNTATVLRAVVKSHNRLKRTVVTVTSNVFQNLQGRAHTGVFSL